MAGTGDGKHSIGLTLFSHNLPSTTPKAVKEARFKARGMTDDTANVKVNAVLKKDALALSRVKAKIWDRARMKANDVIMAKSKEKAMARARARAMSNGIADEKRKI